MRSFHPIRRQFKPEASQTQAPITPATEPERRAGEGLTTVERDSLTGQPPTDDAEDTVIKAMRDLARWLYRQLRQEYEHQTSDAAVDEAIQVNAWTFTAEGRRFG